MTTFSFPIGCLPGFWMVGVDIVVPMRKERKKFIVPLLNILKLFRSLTSNTHPLAPSVGRRRNRTPNSLISHKINTKNFKPTSALGMGLASVRIMLLHEKQRKQSFSLSLRSRNVGDFGEALSRFSVIWKKMNKVTH